MDLTKYRASELESKRSNDIICHIPDIGGSALDVGARDGHFSKTLAKYFSVVTALDLILPVIDHPRIECVKGDITKLDFEDNYFDFILCAEVLEHIRPQLLHKACSELLRICKYYLFIGVPYKQDIRIDRTNCRNCGRNNPPWGHVNTFDEHILRKLFQGLKVEKMTFIGKNKSATNRLSCLLMDLAGNPYGTYCQEEPCIHCGAKLISPAPIGHLRKILATAAFYSRKFTTSVESAQWIHMLFNKI